MATEITHKKLRLRDFNGEVNRAREVYVPVYFSSDEENGTIWIEITKTSAKEISEYAKEVGIEEIEGVTIDEEGCMYIEGPSEEGGGEGGEEAPKP